MILREFSVCVLEKLPKRADNYTQNNREDRIMDQKKIGAFLREQRKKKELTQEMPAEMLGVSNRTVSRWETGAGMPDFPCS